MKLRIVTGPHVVDLDASPDEAAEFLASLGKEAGVSGTAAPVTSSSTPSQTSRPTWWRKLPAREKRTILCMALVLSQPRKGIEEESLKAQLGVKSALAWKRFLARLRRELAAWHKTVLLMEVMRHEDRDDGVRVWFASNVPLTLDFMSTVTPPRTVEEILDAATSS